MNDSPQQYQRAFYVDGSLRDIYIHGTTVQDWQKLLTFLRSSSYPLELISGGHQRPIPEQIEDIFLLAHADGVTLRVDAAHLALNCHFYTSQEIEFDLDPRDMNSEQQIARLLDFLRTIGRLLHKAVVLTPENASWVPLFRFDPNTDEEQWFVEGTASIGK
jgi:hypothetical protein